MRVKVRSILQFMASAIAGAGATLVYFAIRGEIVYLTVVGFTLILLGLALLVYLDPVER